MKVVQQRLETRERSTADPRIMPWFGLLGFRSQPIVAAPLHAPHTQYAQSEAVHHPIATPLLSVCTES